MKSREHQTNPDRLPSSPSSAAQPELQQRSFTDAEVLEETTLQSKQLARGHHFGEIPIYSKPIKIQPKLTVGEPNDQYEQEADRVAAQVMSMGDPAPQQPVQRQTEADDELQTKLLESSITPLIQRETSEDDELQMKTADTSQIQRETLEDDELQTKADSEEAPQVGYDLEGQLSQSQGGGSPLPQDVRSFMEPRFGTDFSNVRVHTDSSAIHMNQSLGAQAFTHQQDLYFGAGKYDPGSNSGKELLAHELTHVVQQTGGTASLQEKEDIHASDPAIRRDLINDFVLGASNIYHDVAEGVGLESHSEAEAARLQAFLDHGLFGPEALVPPTNIGGFDASYNPQSQQLFIEVRTGVNFINGLALDGANVITALHPDLAQAAIDGNAIPTAGGKASFVSDFTWNRAQERNFLRQLRTRVLDAWDGQYSFFCQRPGWESVVADVVVDVDVHRGDAGEDDHMQTTTYKVPESGRYQVGAFVDGDRTSATNAFDQDPRNNELVMSSTHVNPQAPHRNLLQKTVLFDNDSAILTPAAQGTLNAFAADFQDANLDLTNPVQLVGHASSPGTTDHNERLAQARIDAVRDHLSSVGFTGINDRVSTQNVGEAGATEDPEWRRVDLIVGDGQSQIVAAHEFGHVFGLMDEYAINPGGSISGTGNPTGTVVGHDAMAQAIGTDGAIAENNDGIMSLGNVVRPQHYATFGWALRRVTGIDEWQVG